MKIKHILLCGWCITSACSNPQKDQAEKLEKEVMMIHDAVMPKMGELISLKSAISKRIAQLDSITQSTPTDSLSHSLLKNALLLSSQLKKADDGMMDWMHRYKGDSLKKLAPEEAIKALTHEKIKIEQVSDDMLKSIEDAQKFLKQQ
ncbi:hypothetical protein FHS57_005490 [Runella defluvii]|uniref:Viral A-type inclusion protein n=1 Tax=Runella defluvii TaxID=370973 RepID=A0A7W5ZPT5_9BACT|nr:viral A-type inclusion protein [Runella defluvii]MBB3841462.1 hypothetical protein [Runella defluvii]